MERRAFLASLAALFVARRLPASESAPAIGDVIEIRESVLFTSGAHRIPPDVWGDDNGEVAFTIMTS